jgi:hypothetical protein
MIIFIRTMLLDILHLLSFLISCHDCYKHGGFAKM